MQQSTFSGDDEIVGDTLMKQYLFKELLSFNVKVAKLSVKIGSEPESEFSKEAGDSISCIVNFDSACPSIASTALPIDELASAVVDTLQFKDGDAVNVNAEKPLLLFENCESQRLINRKKEILTLFEQLQKGTANIGSKDAIVSTQLKLADPSDQSKLIKNIIALKFTPAELQNTNGKEWMAVYNISLDIKELRVSDGGVRVDMMTVTVSKQPNRIRRRVLV